MKRRAWNDASTADQTLLRSDAAAVYKLASFDLDQVAPAQLAVDCKIEQGSVTYPLFTIEQEADGPYLLRFQRPFGAEQPTRVPCASITRDRIGRTAEDQSESVTSPSDALDPGMAMVTKPFVLDTLVARVRELMDAALPPA